MNDAIWRGDALLKLKIDEFSLALPADFDGGGTVVLMHGFTANGKYLKELGQYLEKSGFNVLLFNYNSYKGITDIAKSLENLLRKFENITGKVSKGGFFIVAHSLGGLVARQLALYEWLTPIIRGIVMLGTPNNGAFKDKKILEYMIDYGQSISEVMLTNGIACKTAKELTKTDITSTLTTMQLGVIDTINANWSALKTPPPSITISGGKNQLEFSKNKKRDWLANQAVQRMMDGEINDGLVHEKSVNLTNIIPSKKSATYTHFNTYPEYSYINHTNLKENQDIFLQIITWLIEVTSSYQAITGTTQKNLSL